MRLDACRVGLCINITVTVIHMCKVTGVQIWCHIAILRPKLGQPKWEKSTHAPPTCYIHLMAFHPVSSSLGFRFSVMVRFRVLGLGSSVRVRVSVTGSVSYLNKKFVVVLAFIAPSVDHKVLLGGNRCG